MFMRTKGDTIFSSPLNSNSTFRPIPELSPSPSITAHPPLTGEGQRNPSKSQQSLLVQRAHQHNAISIPAVEIDTTAAAVQPLPLPLPYPYLLPCGALTQRGSPAPSTLPNTVLKSTSRAVKGSVPMDTAQYNAYNSSTLEAHHDREEDNGDRVCASTFKNGRPKNKRVAACRFISLVVVSVITLAGLYMVWYSSSIDMRKEVPKSPSSLEDRGVKVGPVDFLDTAAGAFVAKLLASGAILVVSLLGIVVPLWLARRGSAAIPSTSEGAKRGRGLRGDESTVSSKGSSSAFLSLGNCFSAGLLLGMGALHFLPEAVEAYQRRLLGLLLIEEAKSNHTHNHSENEHSGEDKFVFLALLCGLCIPLLIDTIQHSLTHMGIIGSEHAHSHSHGHGHSHDATRDDKSSDTVVGKPLHTVVVGSGGRSCAEEQSELSKGLNSGACAIGGILVDVHENADLGAGHARDEESKRSEAKGHTTDEVGSKGSGGSPYGTFLEKSEIHERSDLLKPSTDDIMNAMGTEYADQRANTTNQSTSRGKQYKVTYPSPSSSSNTASNMNMSSVIILSCLLTFHGLTEGFMLGLEASGTAITSIMVPLCIHKFFDAFVLGLRIVRQTGGEVTGSGGLDAHSRRGGGDVSKKKSGSTSSTSCVAFIKSSFWAVVAVFSTPISLIIIALLYYKGGALLSHEDVANESSSLSSPSSPSSSRGHNNTVPNSEASLLHAHKDLPSLAYVASQAVGAGSFLYIALGDILPMEFHGVGLGSSGGGGSESGAASKGVVAHRWRQLLWIFAGIAFVHAQSIFFPHKH